MANSLELELRQILLNPPEPPFFNQGEVIKGLVRPENLGIVDLDTARNLVFRGQEKLHHDWQLSRGIDGLEVEVVDWLDLPYSARLRTVIERTIIIPDSFCGRLVCNSSFRRLFEIFQWGPKRDEPTWNPHNRGEHTLEFLGLLDLSLDTLWGKQRELFIHVIRRDLKDYDDVSQLNEKALYILYKKIGMAAVFLHDIATPAAGDAIKPVLIGSNGQMYDEALGVDSFLRMPQNNTLKDLIDKEGLTPYYDLIVTIISGKSDTLLGSLISPIDKDKIKLDTIAYLLLDGSKFNFLRHFVPGIERRDNKRDFPSFLVKLGLVADDLVDEHVLIGGYSDTYNIPLAWLNIVPSIFLTPDGEIGFADSLGLRMLLYFNTVMAFDAYQGPKMLVVEDQVQQLIRNLPSSDREDLLDKDFIYTVGSREFYNELARVLGEDLLLYIYASGSFRRYLLPRSYLTDSFLDKYSNLRRFPLIGLKPKIGTITRVGDKVGVFNELYPDDSKRLTDISQTFKDSLVVMVDLNETDPRSINFLSQFPSVSSLRLPIS